MEKLVFILAIASLSVAQQQFVKDPREAAILTEKRYLSNNGQFGSAFTQEDGVQFTEESDQDGNRRGAYSYIDPTGQRRTITYTAGKNGFQASGDHLPVAPPAPAAPAPVAPQVPNAPQGPSAPAAARQYSVTDNNEEGQYHPIYDDVDYWERQSKSRPAAAAAPVQGQWSSANAAPAPAQWNAAPAAAPQQWSAPAAPAARSWSEAAPAPAPAQAQWNAPAPAPAQSQWSAPAAPAARSWSEAAPAPAPAQWNAPAPAARSWNSPAPAAPQSWEFNSVASTEAPSRFFPPGKLDLSRSPDGFSYSFSKS